MKVYYMHGTLPPLRRPGAQKSTGVTSHFSPGLTNNVYILMTNNNLIFSSIFLFGVLLLRDYKRICRDTTYWCICILFDCAKLFYFCG